MKPIILVLDVRSTSISCTGYEYLRVPIQYHNSRIAEPLISALEGISHTIPMSTVIPSKGCIQIYKVLATIDECIDEMLWKCKNMSGSNYQIVAIGFSAFVMNLVGVDINGYPVGEEATLSSGCNREDVAKECQYLRTKLGPEKLDALYQRTGSPIHVSCALPQLIAFYGNEKNQGAVKEIDKWQTISSICLHHWSGNPHIQMPISYSEASLSGMFDFRTCFWANDIVDLVETCNGIGQYKVEEDDEKEEDIDIFPLLMNFDAPLPFLRGGIAKYHVDGGKNHYWERWPELRASTVNLYFGVGGAAHESSIGISRWTAISMARSMQHAGLGIPMTTFSSVESCDDDSRA